ncbi:hypothetical protein ACS0TY_027341 [Phlomoides rotata]
MPKESCSKPGKLCYRRVQTIHPGRFYLQLRGVQLSPQLPPQGLRGENKAGGEQQQEEVQN